MQEETLSEFLGVRDRAKVLLLGTFHFAYPNADILKFEDKVDMLSERRQAEIAEVVGRLLTFHPNKVALEGRLEDDTDVNQGYQAYRAGDFQLTVAEHHQLGFQVAAKMNHDRVYMIDELRGRPYMQDEELFQYARKRLGEAGAGLSEMQLWYSLQEGCVPEYAKRLMSYYGRMLAKQTLREHLLFLDSDERCAADHGLYLSWADSDPGDYTMPDHVAGWWYARNLRIFANLKRITESPDDRILVIFGAGHTPILKHLLSCSPKHELVDLRTYLA